MKVLEICLLLINNVYVDACLMFQNDSLQLSSFARGLLLNGLVRTNLVVKHLASTYMDCRVALEKPMFVFEFTF